MNAHELKKNVGSEPTTSLIRCGRFLTTSTFAGHISIYTYTCHNLRQHKMETYVCTTPGKSTEIGWVTTRVENRRRKVDRSEGLRFINRSTAWQLHYPRMAKCHDFSTDTTPESIYDTILELRLCYTSVYTNVETLDSTNPREGCLRLSICLHHSMLQTVAKFDDFLAQILVVMRCF